MYTRVHKDGVSDNFLMNRMKMPMMMTKGVMYMLATDLMMHTMSRTMLCTMCVVQYIDGAHGDECI